VPGQQAEIAEQCPKRALGSLERPWAVARGCGQPQAGVWASGNRGLGSGQQVWEAKFEKAVEMVALDHLAI
jgi:hypothetical protein